MKSTLSFIAALLLGILMIGLFLLIGGAPAAAGTPGSVRIVETHDVYRKDWMYNPMLSEYIEPKGKAASHSSQSGTPVLQAERVGYTFSPGSHLAGAPGPRLRNFTPTLSEISGQVVEPDGTPLSGAILSAGPGLNTLSGPDGLYTIGDLPDGSYAVSAYKTGYTFSPASHSVSVPPDARGKNFTGTLSAASAISGQITNQAGHPIEGATVTDGGSLNASSGSDGSYNIANVSDGYYLIYPEKVGYVFSPASQLVGVPPDARGKNFTGTIVCDVTGQVVDPDGSPVAGAIVSDGAGKNFITGPDGNYTLSFSPEGSDAQTPYTLSAYKVGYTFSPVSHLIWVPESTSPDRCGTGLRNFTATLPVIAGQVLNQAGHPIEDVTVTDGAGLSVSTGVGGNYSMNAPAGSYYIYPEKVGYVFSPASHLVSVPPDARGRNFTGTIVCDVTGQVVEPDGLPISGATVTLNNRQTFVTGSDGLFTFQASPEYGYAQTAYPLSVSKVGYTFSPSSRTIWVPLGTEPDQCDTKLKNFTGTMPLISGQVVDESGNPMAGIEIMDGDSLNASTDAGGYYTMTHVMPDTYLIYPENIGYVFSPASYLVSVPPDARGRNFTARLPHISGLVVDQDGLPLEGVRITDGAGYEATTGAGGVYTITNVYSGTYVIYPEAIDYTFEPASRLVSVPPDAEGHNFTGTLEAFPVYLPFVLKE